VRRERTVRTVASAAVCVAAALRRETAGGCTGWERAAPAGRCGRGASRHRRSPNARARGHTTRGRDRTTYATAHLRTRTQSAEQSHDAQIRLVTSRQLRKGGLRAKRAWATTRRCTRRRAAMLLRAAVSAPWLHEHAARPTQGPYADVRSVWSHRRLRTHARSPGGESAGGSATQQRSGARWS
jgi:hypothetical protein